MNADPEIHGINIFGEKSLHAALKRWYAQPGDRHEVEVDGYVIDLVRGDMLIEIQTRNTAALKLKLATLLRSHVIRLVYPIPQLRWIVKLDGGREVSRRKSPRRGGVVHVFRELVHIHSLFSFAYFSLDVLLTHDEEIRHNDGKGSWRRKGWSIGERRLLGVVGSDLFQTPHDFLRLLPPGLPEIFTTADLSAQLGQTRPIAQQMVYCLKHWGLVQMLGRQGRSMTYGLSDGLASWNKP